MEESSTPQIQPAPEVPKEPIKKDSHQITILAMALFVLASLSITGFLYYQNQVLKKMLASYQAQVSPTPSAAETSVEEATANWKTYTNDKYKFSISYPKEATIVPNEAVFKIFISGEEFPLGAYVWIDVFNNPRKLSLSLLGNETYATSDEEIEWKSVSFLDQNAFIAEYIPPGDSGPTTIYLFEKDGLVFSLARSRVEEPNSSYFTDLTNQILSTFEFLDNQTNQQAKECYRQIKDQATMSELLANPAAVFCICMGGQVETRETTGGQQGFCLIDNQEYDEWQYFKKMNPEDKTFTQ